MVGTAMHQLQCASGCRVACTCQLMRFRAVGMVNAIQELKPSVALGSVPREFFQLGVSCMALTGIVMVGARGR